MRWDRQGESNKPGSVCGEGDPEEDMSPIQSRSILIHPYVGISQATCFRPPEIRHQG